MIKKSNFKLFLLLQVTFVIFSLTFVFGKKASMYTFFEFKFCLFFILELMALAFYALLWQQVLKRVELSVAYLNKGVVVFWSLLWAKFIFNEQITLKNIVGVCVIVVGISVVNSDE